MRTSHGLVLIDSGMNSDGADVHAGLREINATPDEIRAILLTHWHNDHAAGAHALHALTGAPVYYHRGDEPFYTGRAGAIGLRRWLSDQIPEWGVFVLAKGLLGEATPRAVVAQHLVEDGDVILDEFDVITTPGHTPGHVCYFYRPAKALFAGDALAVIEGRIRFMARPVTPDINAARASLEKCLAVSPEIICPGHRAPLTAGVAAACEGMRSYLSRGGPWPLFG